jgi:hypothetical protein
VKEDEASVVAVGRLKFVSKLSAAHCAIPWRLAVLPLLPAVSLLETGVNKCCVGLLYFILYHFCTRFSFSGERTASIGILETKAPLDSSLRLFHRVLGRLIEGGLSRLPRLIVGGIV